MGYTRTCKEPVETDNPLEQEIALWERRIGEKAAELAEATQKGQDTRNTLRVFVGEYNSRVGVHYAKLEKLELEIKEYQHRLEKLRQGVADIAEVERDLERVFKKERERIQQIEEEINRSSETYKKHLRDQELGEKLSPDLQKKIKILFRKLALKFHPDKAEDEDQARDYQKIMAAINEAYANGDFDVLVLYMQQAEREEKIARETLEEKLARLKVEYEKICKAAEKAARELANTVESATAKLRQRVEDAKLEGEDLLMGLTRTAMQRIRELEEELDELVMDCEEMLQGIPQAGEGT